MKARYNLAGETFLITGAASGLCASIAADITSMGGVVVGLDINDTVSDDPLRKADVSNVIFKKVDLTDYQEVEKLLVGLKKEFGNFRSLLNGVGFYPNTQIEEISSDEWDTVININLSSVFFLSRMFVTLGLASQNRSSITNITSISANVPEAALVHYSAAKAGVGSLTLGLAKSFASKGIRVNAISPGLIESPGVHLHDPKRLVRYKERACLERVPQYRDFLGLYLFLTSDYAQAVTGQEVVVDAGVMLSDYY